MNAGNDNVLKLYLGDFLNLNRVNDITASTHHVIEIASLRDVVASFRAFFPQPFVGWMKKRTNPIKRQVLIISHFHITKYW